MNEINKVHQLNEYLKKLEEDKLGLEEVTDQEIVSLLKLAIYLKENLRVCPSPRFRQRIKEDLLVAWQRKRLNQYRRLARIIILAAAFFFLLSGLAIATWRSQPGSLLYPLKRFLQKADGFLKRKSFQPIPANRGKKQREEMGKGKKEQKKKEKKKRKGKIRKKRRQIFPPVKKKIQPVHSRQRKSHSRGNRGFVREREGEFIHTGTDGAAFRTDKVPIKTTNKNFGLKKSENQVTP